MNYTVKQLSALTGLTPRTLRWYDTIGLLRPRRNGENDYRIYGPAEVERLTQILLYREMGLSLEETDQVGLSRLHYLPEYDAFYSAARDTAIVLPHFTAGAWRKDGTVELIYHDKLECFRENCNTPEEVYSLVLTPWKNSWHLVSNTQIAPQSP